MTTIKMPEFDGDPEPASPTNKKKPLLRMRRRGSFQRWDSKEELRLSSSGDGAAGSASLPRRGENTSSRSPYQSPKQRPANSHIVLPSQGTDRRSSGRPLPPPSLASGDLGGAAPPASPNAPASPVRRRKKGRVKRPGEQPKTGVVSNKQQPPQTSPIKKTGSPRRLRPRRPSDISGNTSSKESTVSYSSPKPSREEKTTKSIRRRSVGAGDGGIGDCPVTPTGGGKVSHDNMQMLSPTETPVSRRHNRRVERHEIPHSPGKSAASSRNSSPQTPRSRASSKQGAKPTTPTRNVTKVVRPLNGDEHHLQSSPRSKSSKSTVATSRSRGGQNDRAEEDQVDETERDCELWPVTPSIASHHSRPSKPSSRAFRQLASSNDIGELALDVTEVDDDDDDNDDANDDVVVMTEVEADDGPIDDMMSVIGSGGEKATKLYQHARRCEWDDVLKECRENPRDAKFVSKKDGTTALHLAVMSRANPVLRDGGFEGYQPAPRLVIEALLVACPEAAITRCTIKRYTPLTYACLVPTEGYHMGDAADMIVTILRHAPHSAYVFTDDGFSGLDVHILSYSRSQERNHDEELYSVDTSSTVVLQTLLSEKPELAESRTYKNKVRGPVELLYRCNMDAFKQAVNGEQDFQDVSALGDWWAWKWAALLLQYGSYAAGQQPKSDKPFRVVQAAAQLVGCPSPILTLAIRMFPQQVSGRDPRGEIYNMPLHDIASWRCDHESIAGDPLVSRRKAKAIRVILDAYPDAARCTNNMGETALQLAIEAGTPWYAGLATLVHACPKALKFPRKLRPRTDTNSNSLSVSYHSRQDDEGDDDDSENCLDPAAAIDGSKYAAHIGILETLFGEATHICTYFFPFPLDGIANQCTHSW